MHLRELALISTVFMVFAPAGPSAPTSQISDPVLDHLERVNYFAFGGVGFALVTSRGELDYRAILSRKSAADDFETVFKLGNPQARCYALTGLRQINPGKFERLAATLQSSTTCVAVSRGCVTFEHPMAEIIARIRSGMYSGPMTHDLIPPVKRANSSSMDHEQTKWERAFALFFSPSSQPSKPAPPPGPPPPPPNPNPRRHIACVADDRSASQ
jgi:hypothetical protein